MTRLQIELYRVDPQICGLQMPSRVLFVKSASGAALQTFVQRFVETANDSKPRNLLEKDNWKCYVVAVGTGSLAVSLAQAVRLLFQKS